MWTVNESNATAVIVASASAMSCAVGALAAHIFTKKYVTAKYEALITEEIRMAKAYFSKRHKTGEYADPVALAEKMVSDEYEEEAERYSKNSTEEIFEKAIGQPLRPRPQAKPISKPEPEEDMEAFEQRLIDEAKSEVEEVKQRLGAFDDDDSEDEEVVTMNVFSNQEPSDEDILDKSGRKSGRPYIISHDEFFDGELDYMQNSLTYFEGDDVLTDERDQPIHHMNKIVGETNIQFGKASQDPNIVYIRNDELEVDFEVCRSTGKFTEEVLGFVEHSDKPRLRKFREYD